MSSHLKAHPKASPGSHHHWTFWETFVWRTLGIMNIICGFWITIDPLRKPSNHFIPKGRMNSIADFWNLGRNNLQEKITLTSGLKKTNSSLWHNVWAVTMKSQLFLGKVLSPQQFTTFGKQNNIWYFCWSKHVEHLNVSNKCLHHFAPTKVYFRTFSLPRKTWQCLRLQNDGCFWKRNLL